MYIDDILSYAQRLNNIDKNDYFIYLHDLPIEKFVISQLDFILAVDEWSKLLAKLIIMVPSVEHRIAIAENLYEENGNGDINLSHVYTFNKFIKSLTNEKDIYIRNKNILKSMNNFINELNKQFDTQPWQYCVSMLGMIEYVYITVSNNIYNYTLSHIKNPNNIHHYKIHETLDVKHSLDLFKIVQNEDLEITFNGMKHGYELFYELYSDMYLHITTSE